MLISMCVGRVLISQLQWMALAEMKFPCRNGTSTTTLHRHHGGVFLGRLGGRFLGGSDVEKKLARSGTKFFLSKLLNIVILLNRTNKT